MLRSWCCWAPLGSTLDMWEPQVAALAASYRVVAPMSRGHGGSPVPPGPYDIDDLADDALLLLDDLGSSAPTSSGCRWAAWPRCTSRRATLSRVDRLAVLCTSALLGPPQMWSDRAALVRAGGWRPSPRPSSSAGSRPVRREPPRDRRLAGSDGARAPARRATPRAAGSSSGWTCAPTSLDRGTDAGDRRRRRPGHAADAPGSSSPTGCRTVALLVVDAAAALGQLRAGGGRQRGDPGHIWRATRRRREQDDDRERRHGRRAVEQGMAVRREVARRRLRRRHRDRADAFTEPFQDLITRYAWGDIWSRPGLDRRAQHAHPGRC